MVLQSAQNFIERLKNDDIFRDEYENSSNPEQFIKAAGFDFTRAEMAQLKDSLNDDELSDVAGGGFHCPVLSNCSNAGHTDIRTSCTANCTQVCTMDINLNPPT